MRRGTSDEQVAPFWFGYIKADGNVADLVISNVLTFFQTAPLSS